jgi:hypothetical protein
MAFLSINGRDWRRDVENGDFNIRCPFVNVGKICRCAQSIFRSIRGKQYSFHDDSPLIDFFCFGDSLFSFEHAIRVMGNQIDALWDVNDSWVAEKIDAKDGFRFRTTVPGLEKDHGCDCHEKRKNTSLLKVGKPVNCPMMSVLKRD